VWYPHVASAATKPIPTTLHPRPRPTHIASSPAPSYKSLSASLYAQRPGCSNAGPSRACSTRPSLSTAGRPLSRAYRHSPRRPPRPLADFFVGLCVQGASSLAISGACLCFSSEGSRQACGGGGFFEGFRLRALWKLPVVLHAARLINLYSHIGRTTPPLPLRLPPVQARRLHSNGGSPSGMVGRDRFDVTTCCGSRSPRASPEDPCSVSRDQLQPTIPSQACAPTSYSAAPSDATDTLPAITPPPARKEATARIE